MSRPSNDWFVQQLQLLLTGYGYNFYNEKNMARSDDLLVRQKAASSLGECVQTLATLETEYQRRYIPAATRENPFPPAEAMNKLRDISLLRQRVGDLEGQIRGMSVPTQDRIWWRFREEQNLLNQLLGFDYELVRQTDQVSQWLRGLTPENWHTGPGRSGFDLPLQQLDNLIRDRQRFLQIPG
jgi:hypothetical protein